MNMTTSTAEGGCPMGHGAARKLLGRTNNDWWPDALAVDILAPNGASNPMGAEFDYAEAFEFQQAPQHKATVIQILH